MHIKTLGRSALTIAQCLVFILLLVHCSMQEPLVQGEVGEKTSRQVEKSVESEDTKVTDDDRDSYRVGDARRSLGAILHEMDSIPTTGLNPLGNNPYLKRCVSVGLDSLPELKKVMLSLDIDQVYAQFYINVAYLTSGVVIGVHYGYVANSVPVSREARALQEKHIRALGIGLPRTKEDVAKLILLIDETLAQEK